MSLTIGLAGMDPATETALKAAFIEANERLGDRWQLLPETQADHIVVDMDSMYGPMSWLPRGLDRWLLPYIAQSSKRRTPRAGEAVHVLLCVADHYEPHVSLDGRPVSDDVAMRRVDAWVERYPKLFSCFADSDGRSPRPDPRPLGGDPAPAPR